LEDIIRYECSNCKRSFPVVAWIYGRYLNDSTCGWIQVKPSAFEEGVTGVDQDAKEFTDIRYKLANLVRKPCCPFCLSTDIGVGRNDQK